MSKKKFDSGKLALEALNSIVAAKKTIEKNRGVIYGETALTIVETAEEIIKMITRSNGFGEDLLLHTKRPIYGMHEHEGAETLDGAKFFTARISDQYSKGVKPFCAAQIAPNGEILLYTDIMYDDVKESAARCKSLATEMAKGVIHL